MYWCNASKGWQQNNGTGLTQSYSSYLGDKRRNKHEILNLTVNWNNYKRERERERAIKDNYFINTAPIINHQP